MAGYSYTIATDRLGIGLHSTSLWQGRWATRYMRCLRSLEEIQLALKSNDPRDSRTWRKLRLVILARDQWTCGYCNQPATTIDHIIPVSKAPDLALNPENCISACKRCNSSKGSRSAGSFLAPAFTPPVFPVSASLTRSKVHQDSPFTTRPNPSQ